MSRTLKGKGRYTRVPVTSPLKSLHEGTSPTNSLHEHFTVYAEIFRSFKRSPLQGQYRLGSSYEKNKMTAVWGMILMNTLKIGLC